MKQAKILVMEDSEHITLMLQKCLKMLGSEEEWFFGKSIADLRRMWPTIAPDILLCDISLSDGDSSEALKELRKNYSHPCKTIAYTSYNESYLQDLPQFDQFISKSTDPMTVIKRCQTLARQET